MDTVLVRTILTSWACRSAVGMTPWFCSENATVDPLPGG